MVRSANLVVIDPDYNSTTGRTVRIIGLATYAEHRGLPVSTVVRMLVLQAIAPADDLKSALDRLESDLVALRRKALSA